MQIELIGCTSAGKSVLTRSIMQVGDKLGLDMFTSYDFVLRQIRLDWIKNHTLRMFVLNIFTLLVCLLSWRKNLKFYGFVSGVILQLPTSVSFLEKIKIARIFARNLGIYEIANRNSYKHQFILADEGTLQIVHYLFVHVSLEPDIGDITEYLRLAPKPDLVIYVQKDEEVLIERTLARGHKRIPEGTLDEVRLFIKRAGVSFDHSVQLLTNDGLPLLIVNDNGLTQVNHNNDDDPISCILLDAFQAGLNAIDAESPLNKGQSQHGFVSVAS